jgi:phage virion morphogenesis protein
MSAAIVQLNDAVVLAALKNLAQHLGDLSPAMAAIAGVLADVPERALAAQSSPDGAPWPALAQSTITRRTARGHWPGLMLQETGHMMSSIQSEHGQTHAAVGTNVVYAALHQLGGTPGMPPGPRSVPPRPFLGLARTDTDEILGIIRSHLST